jgi:hypothetical protein
MSGKKRKFLNLGAGLSVLSILMFFAQSISPASAAGEVVTVNLAVASGSPTYRASGFIYGIAADGSNPPNSTLTDIKTRFLRAGGAQLGCPNGGYVNGQYTPRWNVVKAYYAKAKAIGAKLLILTHDLWGADAVCNVPRWPGQGGNWTEYTTFMNQVITDAIANGMTGSDVRWELWNEPDLSFFWGGTQAQWLEMWKRGYQLVRSRIPGAVFEGPSLATGPGGSWASAFLDYVKANNVVPNYISWHDEGGGNDPVGEVNTMNSALSSRGISVSGIDINEYGTSSEQNPGHSAWFIARMERANGGVDALRGNWGMAGGLYQGMGDLVNSSWQPLGQWWIYKRYGDQTGQRASVTPSSNNQIDAVAFTDSAASKSIIVVGNKGGTTGNINVQINGIPAYLQNGGQTRVLMERMPAGTSVVSAPTVVSNNSMVVSGSSLTVVINWANTQDGYVLTLTPGTGGPMATPTRTPTPGGTFPVAGTYYRLINRNSGKVAEVSNFSTADGGNVQQWSWTGTSSQQWSFVSVGGGYYNVINRGSGKCLDVNGVSTADGANVQQWTCGTGTNQRWSLTSLAGGYYRLTAQHSGKVLDVVGNGTADGVNIDQWPWNNGNNQQWQIVP